MIRDALRNSSRRTFLKGTAGAALGGAAMSFVGRLALAADLKTVRFSEAVHNLGYINLYVGMHSDIFKKMAWTCRSARLAAILRPSRRCSAAPRISPSATPPWQ